MTTRPTRSNAPNLPIYTGHDRYQGALNAALTQIFTQQQQRQVTRDMVVGTLRVDPLPELTGAISDGSALVNLIALLATLGVLKDSTTATP